MSYTINIRAGTGFDFQGGSGGVVGTPLTVAVTPVQVKQTSPGAQLFTATPAGGTLPYSYAWSVKFADGSNANAYLSSLTGNTTTLTATARNQSFLVTCVVTDSTGPTPLTASDSSILTVDAPSNLTAQISPTNASQASPAGQLFTVTPSGGVAPYSYAWSATFTDGTNANAYLSALVGASVTLTSTNYRQSFRVACVVTDSSPSAQTANVAAVVSVGEPPALVAPTNLSPTQLVSGTTSAPFTFGNASAGAPPYTYTMIVQSSTGAATLTAYTGQSATIQGLTDGATAQVTIQALDSLGQTATATYVVGVGVVPIFNENAIWNLVGGTDLRTIGSGSRSGNGTLVVGGITFTMLTAAGTPTGPTLDISAAGLVLSFTGTVGDATSVWWNTNLLTNFTTGEHILVNMLFSTAALPTNATALFTFGDSTSYLSGNGYGFSLNWDANGARVARRLTGGTSTNFILASGQLNANKTYTAQVLLVAGRLPYCTISEGTSFLGGPRLGLAQPMRGTFTGTPGSQSTSSGATFSPPISSLRMQVAGATGVSVTFLAYEVRRLTRAS